MRFELTPDEGRILQDFLRREIADLRMEIADTDQKDFRDILKGKKETLKTIVGKLERMAA
ncbi:MAG: hypothetical protein GXP58_06875 [Deltaproteobacteria bacterium]|nr:hypothetical protein [Deltaproteobacteria bacterium]